MRDRRRLEKHVLFELDEDEIIDDINFGEVNAKYYPNLRGYYSHEIKGNWFDSGIWTYFKDSVRHIVITFMIILNHGFLNTSVQEKSNVNLSLYIPCKIFGRSQTWNVNSECHNRKTDRDSKKQRKNWWKIRQDSFGGFERSHLAFKIPIISLCELLIMMPPYCVLKTKQFFFNLIDH